MFLNVKNIAEYLIAWLIKLVQLSWLSKFFTSFVRETCSNLCLNFQGRKANVCTLRVGLFYILNCLHLPVALNWQKHIVDDFFPFISFQVLGSMMVNGTQSDFLLKKILPFSVLMVMTLLLFEQTVQCKSRLEINIILEVP